MVEKEKALELSKEWQELLNRPRVLKGKDLPPVQKDKPYSGQPFPVQETGLGTFIVFIENFAPGGKSQKHGHMNEAIFYILEGKGYEIHDGKRYEWEAGDVVVVHNGCVHQHHNLDPENWGRALVINPKPLFLAMNLKAQRLVEQPPGMTFSEAFVGKAASVGWGGQEEGIGGRK